MSSPIVYLLFRSSNVTSKIFVSNKLLYQSFSRCISTSRTFYTTQRLRKVENKGRSTETSKGDPLFDGLQTMSPHLKNDLDASKLSVNKIQNSKPDPLLKKSSDSKVINISEDDSDQKEVSIFKRFHQTYKRHGKIFITTHLLTSMVWTSIFYYLVVSGVDVVAFLKWLGVGETIISKLKNPSIGLWASVYILYKLATPFRYVATIGCTHTAVKYLQRRGKMAIPSEENRIKSLIKEGKDKLNHKLKD